MREARALASRIPGHSWLAENGRCRAVRWSVPRAGGQRCRRGEQLLQLVVLPEDPDGTRPSGPMLTPVMQPGSWPTLRAGGRGSIRFTAVFLQEEPGVVAMLNASESHVACSPDGWVIQRV